MVFWIGAMAIAIVVAVAAGWRLLRRTADPAWPAAAGFAIALVAALGAAVQATVASLQTPAPPPIVASAPHGGDGSSDDGAGGSLDQAVERVKKALEEDPNDVDRWALLARTYMALGQTENALSAMGEAVARKEPRDAALLSEYGQIQIAANNGRAAGPPEATFAEVLTMTPDDPRARFFLAIARAEKGDIEGARADLEAMLENAPADAPWRATVFEQLQELGPPPAAEAPRGPTQEQVAAAADMTPEERAEMVRGMVDGLAQRMAENPDDFQGWLRLANAYVVLDEPAKGASALKSALELQPANVGLLVQYAELEIVAANGVVTPEAETAMERAIARQPGNPQAMWRLGQAAAARGETETARRMWTELLPKLLEADPLKADVRAALEGL